MENVHLKTPYKIIPARVKRYTDFYGIPAENCIIIPIKAYGDQVNSEAIWKVDDTIERREGLMFSADNLEAVTLKKDFRMFSVWEEYRGQPKQVLVTG